MRSLRLWFLWFAIVAPFLTLLSATDQPSVLIDKAAVRNAISEFRHSPLTANGRAAAQLVREWAENNDNVLLKITDKQVPFLSNLRLTPEDRNLLLGAYIIGNVDTQLLRNERKDSPYPGVLEVIQTYKRMRELDSTILLPEIEKFVELDKKGELKKYIETPGSDARVSTAE